MPKRFYSIRHAHNFLGECFHTELIVYAFSFMLTEFYSNYNHIALMNQFFVAVVWKSLSLFPAELLTASFNGLIPSTANYFYFMDCQNYCYYLYGWWAVEQMPVYHQSNSDIPVGQLFPTQKHKIIQNFHSGMSPSLFRILICHPHFLFLLSRHHNPGEGSSELIKMLTHSSCSPSVIT